MQRIHEAQIKSELKPKPCETVGAHQKENKDKKYSNLDNETFLNSKLQGDLRLEAIKSKNSNTKTNIMQIIFNHLFSQLMLRYTKILSTLSQH